MSDQTPNDQKFTIEDCKAAVLACLPPPEGGEAEPGKFSAAFDLGKFKSLVGILDQVIQPLAPVIQTFTPPQFQAAVGAVVTAIHLFSEGTTLLPPAPAPAGPQTIG